MVIVINRPHVRNAIDAATAELIGNALEEADSRTDVRSVILTGAGDKAFCAGADLKAARQGESAVPASHPEWGFAGFVRHVISKPVIAAVNGLALGGGTELVLACDLAIACNHAEFGLPEVRRGRFAGAGGLFRLPLQVPQKVAMQMILTGESISASEALAMGLVNAVVASVDELMHAASGLAERVAANAPLAVQASKRLAYGVQGGERRDEASLWTLADRERSRLRESDDWHEGMLAFAERRLPNWSGR